MKKQLIVLSALLLCPAFVTFMFGQCTPVSLLTTLKVNYGLELNGATNTLRVYMSPTEPVDGVFCPSAWAFGSTLTMRWPAIHPGGVPTNPVASLSVSDLGAGFNWAADPAGAQYYKDPGDPGDPGYYYFKYTAATPTNPIPMSSPSTVYVLSANFSLLAGETVINFELVNDVAWTLDPVNNGQATVATSLNNIFGGFVNSSVTFPVEWLYFDAEPISDREAQLTWGTAREQNNHYFEVEKSQDGILFQPIGKVMGVGNSTSQQDYEFLDPNYVAPIVYYRLKQVDLNGQHMYSNIVEVNFKDPSLSKIRFSVYPNPASSYVDIKALAAIEGNYDLQVVDATGREVLKTRFEGPKGEIQLQVGEFSQGVYFIYLMGGGSFHRNVSVGRFVKE